MRVSWCTHIQASAHADESFVVAHDMGDGTEQLCLIKALTGRSLDLVRTMAYKKALDMMNSEVICLSKGLWRGPLASTCLEARACLRWPLGTIQSLYKSSATVQMCMHRGQSLF